MSFRIIFLATLTLAAASAQPSPGRGRGAGAPGGPEARAGAGGGGGSARFLGAEVWMAGRVVKNAPFSADIVTETMQTLPDGNRIRQSSTVRFYRDSEGRTRREQSLRNLNGLAPNSNLPQVAFINDPVTDTNYALNLEKRTATKSGSGGGRGGAFGRMEGRKAPGGAPQPTVRQGGTGGSGEPMEQFSRVGRARQNVRTESLGRQIVEGVPADGTRTTQTIPVGEIGNENPIQVVTETWYSPELQTYVLRKRSDPRSGESATRYTNISRTEPARILFEPPADFKIVEPRGMRKQ